MSTENQLVIFFLSFSGVGFDLWRCFKDGTNDSKTKILGYGWLLLGFFSFVVVVVWVMEQEELKTEIRGRPSES